MVLTLNLMFFCVSIVTYRAFAKMDSRDRNVKYRPRPSYKMNATYFASMEGNASLANRPYLMPILIISVRAVLVSYWITNIVGAPKVSLEYVVNWPMKNVAIMNIIV